MATVALAMACEVRGADGERVGAGLEDAGAADLPRRGGASGAPAPAGRRRRRGGVVAGARRGVAGGVLGAPEVGGHPGERLGGGPRGEVPAGARRDVHERGDGRRLPVLVHHGEVAVAAAEGGRARRAVPLVAPRSRPAASASAATLERIM